MKQPLSVCYISYNESDRIAVSINSVIDFATQIVVIDSYSSDSTKEIAENLGAEVFLSEWKGFVEQKNFAINKANQDWILLLDCDEVVSDELKQSIIDAIINDKIGFYSINRKTHYLGKLMKYSWQPDRVVRLLHKSLNPKFTGELVHEKIDMKDYKSSTLSGNLIHYSYRNIREHFEKTTKYSELSALSYQKIGKKSKLVNLIINPLFAFINMYILKLGILDGWRGIIAAFSSMTGTFLKYAILRELNQTTSAHLPKSK